MARSHAIWIVVDAMGEGLNPWAAFTVRHELVRWLNTRSDIKWLRVLRYPDGVGNYGPQDVKEIPMSELVD